MRSLQRMGDNMLNQKVDFENVVLQEVNWIDDRSRDLGYAVSIFLPANGIRAYRSKDSGN